MAVTCRNIIKGALQKLGVASNAMPITSDQADDGLGSLQSMYQELVSGGAFGRLNDVVVLDTTYSANEFERVACQNVLGVTVTLPDIITTEPTTSYPGAGTADYGFRSSTPLLPRPPIDGSVIQVTDLYSDFSELFIFDSHSQRWVLIEGLALTDEAPLSTRYREGITCKLAAILAPDYSRPVPASVVAGVTAFHSALSGKRDSAVRNIQMPYF